MYLYYTNITGNELVQSKPQLSLGGFKSSTRLTNSQLLNLFGDISQLSINQFNGNQYRGLVLRNESGVSATDIYVWFVYPSDKYCKFRVAAVDMVLDSDGHYQMEHVDSVNSKPLYAEFFEADGKDNKVSLGNLASGEQIGIWIERELLLETIILGESDVYEEITSMDNVKTYREKVRTTVEEIEINLSWI